MFRAVRAFTRAARGSNVLAPEVVGELHEDFPSFPFRVDMSIGYIPPHLQSLLNNASLQIIITPDIMTLYKERPDLKPDDMMGFLASIPSRGVFFKAEKTLALVQQYRNLSESFKRLAENVTRTVLHETGHALCEVYKERTGEALSENEAFVDAFDYDVARLREDPEKFNGVQNWHSLFDMDSTNEEVIETNHSEIFAELFYEHLSGRRNLALFFPHTFAQIPVLLEQVAAYQANIANAPQSDPYPHPKR